MEENKNDILEAEVTPEMREVGGDIIERDRDVVEASFLAREVYIAMRSLEPPIEKTHRLHFPAKNRHVKRPEKKIAARA